MACVTVGGLPVRGQNTRNNARTRKGKKASQAKKKEIRRNRKMARKKEQQNVELKKKYSLGIAHIHTTFNNTIVTITDLEGNAVSWCSSGVLILKVACKSTPFIFAAQMSAEQAAKTAVEFGMQKVRSKRKRSWSR